MAHRYGAYLSFLPAAPGTPAADLEAAVRRVGCPPLQLVWQETRHCILRAPGLPRPLEYVEATCSLQTDLAVPEARDALTRFADQMDAVHPAIGRAEFLHLLPCPIPLATPPLRELEGSPAAPATAAALRRWGLALLPGVVSPTDLTALRDVADAWWARLSERIAALRRASSAAIIRFQEVTERDDGRFDTRLPPGPEDGVVRRLGRSGPWMPLIQAVLGNATLLRQGVVVATPGAGEQYWHSDGPHRGKAAGWDGEDEDPPYAIGVFLPLIDLTPATGYTQFWLGSHRYDRLLDAKGEQCVPGDADGLCTAGTAMLYDFRLLHRGMPNHSPAPRPILYFLYAHPDFNEDYNFGTASIFD